MKNWKRLFAALLALVLMVGMLPPVQASAVGEKQQTASGVHQPTWTHRLLPMPDAQIQNLDPAQYTTVDVAASRLAYEMSQRNAAIQLKVAAASEDYEAVIAQLLELAFAHNGNSAYGDYLAKHWDSYNCSIEYATVDQTVYYTFNFEFVYFTNVEQEVTVATKIDILFNEWDIWHKSDYEKLELIYSWLCENVRYDYKNLEDEDYTLKYSAYAAIMQGTAVCQGYASAFYRMALLAGVDARLITGIGNGGRHAWNIACLDGLYYNLDATWDEGQTEYSWFLKSNANFPDHYRDDEFDSKEFNANYSMAQADYIVNAMCPGTENTHNKENCSYTALYVTTPTCANFGYSAYLCAVCQTAFVDDITSPTGKHTWLNGVCTVCNTAMTESDGLEYILSDDGTYYIVSGIGTCTDTELVIPGIYNGLPVKMIDEYAFDKCDSLTSVTIPDGVTSIGDFAFSYCYSMTGVIIPDSVSSIGRYAFTNCGSLTNVAIPDSVTTISDGVFNFCGKLNVVTIPSSVTSIGSSAFCDCTRLTSITFEGDAPTFGSDVFYNVTATAYYPAGNTTWTSSVMQNYGGTITWVAYDPVKASEGLEYTLSDDGTYYIVIGIGTCTDTELIIPATYNGLPVREIGCDAFNRNQNITKVTLPDSITKIDDRAFGWCYELTNVILPEGLAHIGTQTFNYCRKLERIALPTTLTYLGHNAFWRCEKLTQIHIPTGVEYIGAAAFSACSGLKQLTVAEDNANYCAVDNVLYSKDMTMLLCYAAGKPDGSFVVPGTVENLGEAAFRGSRRLAEIILPNGMIHIADDAFYDCVSLTTITIPASVLEIGMNVFGNCLNLREILVAEDNQLYCARDGVLYSEDGSVLYVYPAGKEGTSFAVPSSVTTLYQNAFVYAPLQEVILPYGLEEIESGAFQICEELTTVTMPITLTYIGNTVFYGCDCLQTILYPGTEERWNAIEKAYRWDEKAGNYVIKFMAFCGEGHTWEEATCTEAKFCIYCGLTEGEALGHDFVDRICSRCGLVSYDGKLVKIYSPYGDTYLTTNNNGGRMERGNVSEATVWTISIDENGYYSFESNGLYLAADGGKYSLGLYDKLVEWAVWELIPADGGFYLRAVAVAENDLGGDSMYYDGKFFTNISFNEKNAPRFTFQLIEVSSCDAYGHSWTAATCQQEKFCTVCGIYGGNGFHSYVDGFCTLCGARCSLGLDYMLEGNHYVVTGIGTCTDTELIIPDSYNGLPVTKIGRDAFWNCNQLTSVTIPGSVTIIEESAFGVCYQLQTVYLSEGLVTIGMYAFQDCAQLESVNLPASLTEIDHGAFAWCYALRQIHIPANVSSIGNQAFAWCPAMESFTVEEDNDVFCAVDGVLYDKAMTELLFYPAAKSNTVFRVPGTVTVICANAFASCQNLREIILPEDLLRIEDMAFEQCSNLQSIQLPAKLVNIGYGAFRECTNLTGIVIPAGVTDIGGDVFGYCTNLTEILVEVGNKAYCSVDGVLYTADMGQLVTYPAGKTDASFAIPEGVIWIHSEAFSGCQYLTEVTFPASLTEINNSAFQSCVSLMHVVLPEGMTRIEGYAFSSCTNLRSITIPASVTYLGWDILQGCRSLEMVIFEGTIAQWNAIEKDDRWNELDWQGSTWDHLVRCHGECLINGHNWVDATCTRPMTCASCGMTEGEALGHHYVDDVCQRCGQLDYEGKVVKIYSPYGDAYLTTNVDKWGQINAADSSEAALWTISIDENGYYSFNSDGFYLGADGGNYTLVLYGEMVEWTRWELIPVDGGFYLRAVSVADYGWAGDYMYFYKRVFTSFSFQEKNAPMFTFQLIPVSDCEAYGHSWTEANCQQEKFCTVCGISGGMGEHNYEGSVCTICGSEHISEGLMYAYMGDHYVVTGIGSCMDSELIIPATYNGWPVTRIEDYAFEQCWQLVSVILPEGMQSIGWGAFRNCDNLKQIQLPQSLIEIEGWAFAYCGQLEDICIPADVADYRAFTFIGCYSLDHIAVDEANPALTEQDGVLYTKDMQTLLCYPAGKMGSFAVPDSVRTIEGHAFATCDNLTAIELPEGLQEIGYGAFSQCYKLMQIQIPSTVYYIESYAFEGCSGLTSVTIPANLTILDNGAFMDCENLAEILVEEGNHSFRSVDGVLYTYNGQTLCAYPAGKAGTSFTVLEGVKTIRGHAFQGCYLKEVVLPHGVAQIDGLAFQGCGNLTTITIPVTLKQIGGSALWNCHNLSTIFYAGSEEAWNAIEKMDGWDGGMSNYKIIFYAFCGDGHTMIEATCIAPRHCAYCDYTEGDVLPHEYENGRCIYCGDVDHGAVIAEGICGERINWVLYEDGHLALMGSGETHDYEPGVSDAPWAIYADQIKNLQISDNITYIGSYAFVGLTGLTELIIPADVEYVGTGAFAGCSGLEKLYLFGLNRCGVDLFEGCVNLKEVFLFHLDMDMTLMYFLTRNALEDQVERMYIRSDLIDISDGEFCTFTCTNAPEYVFVGEYEFVMFTKGNHRWQEMIEQEASCYEWGSAYDYCDLCGAEYNRRELVPMHSYNEDDICTVCGMKPLYVLNCGLRKQDLIKGEDGVYYTKKGQQVLIAVSTSIELLDGLSLADFVEAYSEYIDMETWAKLLASANEDGYALMTDETYGWFLAVTWEYLLEEEERYIPIFLGFYVDRNCDHVWAAATCTAPETCVNCGTTDGAPIDHQYENGFCTMCGEEQPAYDIDGGLCGENVYWTLSNNGVLSFTGFGPMYEGSLDGPDAPWMQYADMVTEVNIEEGITGLYHYAFANFTNLTTITIPASVEQISCGAFLNCTGLQSIVLHNAHRAFTNSFTGCVNLKDVYVLDAYLVGKDPSAFFDNIGLTTYAEHVYMLASLGTFDEAFTRAFSCNMIPEIVNVNGNEYIEYTKQTHDFKQIGHVEPSCMEEGYTAYQCEICGYERTEYIAATGHDYNSDYVCTVCGDAPNYMPFGDLKLSDLILGEDGVYYSPDGHIAVIAVAVPLDWYGGNSLSDYVEAYGDDLFSLTYWSQLLKATNKDGYAVLTEESLVWILDVITGNPAWGEDEGFLPNYLALQIERKHTHQYETVDVAPTCTENGYTIYTCSCGERYIDNVTPALGHKDQDKDGFCDHGCGTEMKPDPNTLIITAEPVKVLTDNWATVTLWVEQNPGFQGMSFYPVITDANGNQVYWPWEVDITNSAFGFEANVGTMIVLTADENCTGTGILLDVKFFVGEDVAIGDYTISFRLYHGECFNDTDEAVAVDLPVVAVDVLNVVYGDANGDRIINLQDVLLLRRYLANRDPETNESPVAVEAGADANGDNIINLQDVLLLRRYLSNRDPETGESPIVLGPQ